ncbi:MAG: adenosylmethionine--8-amino-7-oxononanoate transaminase [Desulfovibrionaceae bacterium]|nr:adenosylmethionine--8-amino-7-oxononanoate transaminase [Desulfovibrionaceae bacterium]
MSAKPGTLWHPCTQMKDHEDFPVIRVARGQGIYLFDEGGKRYLDAVSSWWVNIFGHANPRIASAIARQAQVLEQVILAGFSHAPAEELAERLTALAPAGLEHVFYADNGSSAVEVALKMAHGFFRNQGRAGKFRFTYLDNGYHGETLGALAVCGEDLYSEQFGAIMPQGNLRVAGPDCFRCPLGLAREGCDAPCFQAMTESLKLHADEIAAVIVEPLLQCAGGFRMYPPAYLRRLRQATREAGVLLILDEIATGFGRTGTLFACEQAGISPDLMCVSKGVTGGFLPLSAVLATDEIYAAFYADWAERKAFLHSHSYTGNPLACAAALETLNIFRDEDVLVRNRPKAALLAELVRERFGGHPNVGEVRSLGFVTAVELVADRATKAPLPAANRTGLHISRAGLKRGLLWRNLGDILYFMPPYVITEEEIDRLTRDARAALGEVLPEGEAR